MTTANRSLARTLASGGLAVTAECMPPPGANAAEVKKLAATLPRGLDAVVVADNAEQIRCSALACAAMLAAEGHTAVLSMTTRDRNRIALESDALGAAVMGVSGILCLSGNHQWLGTCPQAAGVYDIDSVQFAQALNQMRCGGLDFTGQRLDPPPGMLIGAVANPALQPLELNLLRLKKKVAAGVDFILTQAATDLDSFARWMDAVRELGLDQKTAVIASVPAAGGAGMASRLKAIPGVRGIHILCGGCESLAASIISEAGLV